MLAKVTTQAASFIVYLHGFNSSPESYKARALDLYMRERGIAKFLKIPVVPDVPSEATAMLSTLVEDLSKRYTVSIVGSSLGGFYATWLAERYGFTAVLVNPAVEPQELLLKYIGENTNYHTDKSWQLDESHIQQFRDLDVEFITQPERYLLMLQKGDETLDYRLAQAKYKNCPSIIEEGGDHSFVDFESHLDRILIFCGFKSGG